MNSLEIKENLTETVNTEEVMNTVETIQTTKDEPSSIVVWFSCGISSAVAGKIILDQYGKDKVDFIYFDIDSAHPDNERFIKECEKLYGKEILRIRGKFKNQYDVIEYKHFINGPYGAPCTYELKKKLRQNIECEKKYDLQIFGYDYCKREINRAIRFLEQTGINARFPLIEYKLTKEDCFKYLSRKIAPPVMYELGYGHNNCIGCVKGGKGYWNKIRQDFPEHFKRMAELERKLGHTCIKNVFLDELKEGEGRNESISVECGIFCDLDAVEIESRFTKEIEENPRKMLELSKKINNKVK